MLKQNTDGLIKEIQKEGCYYISLLKIAEMESNQSFSKNEINELYDFFVMLKYMKSDCGILKPAMIIKYALSTKGIIDKKVFQVGRYVYDVNHLYYWGWTKSKENKVYQNANYTILEGLTENGNIHFRLGNTLGEKIFEPYEPEPYIIKEIANVLYYVK